MTVVPPRRRHRWLLAALALTGAAAAADTGGELTREAGLPLVEKFMPEEYRGFAQVTAVAVRPDGVVAFGSSAAVYLYDRVRFTAIPLPATFATVLQCDRRGRLWVGGDTTVGTIEESPEDGTPRFVSHLEELPAADRAIGNVRGLEIDDAGRVWVATEKGVACLAPGGPARWWPLATDNFPRITLVGGKLVHAGGTTGLSVIEGDRLRPLLPAAALPAKVAGLLPGEGDTVRVVTFGEGVFTCALSGGPLTRRPTGIDALLRARPAGNAVLLPDGRTAITITAGGLMLVDPDWNHARIFAKAHGLNTSRIQCIAADSEDGLWVGTNNGLNRLHLSPALSVFDERSGITPSTIFALTRHDGRLYAGCFDNLHRLVPAGADTGEPARFELDPRSPHAASTLLSTPAGLIVGADPRLVLLPPDGSVRVITEVGDSAQAILALRRDPAIVLAGSERGLHVLRRQGDAYHSIARLRPDIAWWSLAEDADGVVWAGTRSNGILRLEPPADGDWSRAVIRDFPPGTAQLPATHGWTAAYPAFGEVAFLAEDGTHRWDAASQVFPLDRRLALDGRHDVRNYPVATDSQGRVWTSPWHGVQNCSRPLGWFDAGRAWHDAPPAVMAAVGYFGAGRLLLETGRRDILWARGNNALVRIDLGALDRPGPAPAWPAGLRTVRAAGRTWPTRADAAPALPFSREAIEFHYHAPRHEPGTNVRFRTRLLGFDSAWSAPDAAPVRMFTNLSGGPFVFEVQAIDTTGRESGVARYTFTVTPPWHRRGWAYALYVAAGAGAVAGFVRWRLSHAARERLRLEGIVAARTRDLAAARDQAEAASRAKSAFLAAMSHELRTPLNGVIGYAQLLQGDPRLATDQRERLRIVHQSGEHLLRMINDVLDLAKIEAGKIELRPAPFALAELVHDVAAAHAPAAAAKGLAFQRELAADLPAWVEGDPQKLRQILDNLLGNAVKFTARGGVTLRVQRHDEALTFAVADSGPGITAEDQARLFQPFEQARATRPAAPGTGLGLAISRALVERMGGTLTLASEAGAGCTFSFTLHLPALASSAPAAGPAAVSGYEGPRRMVLVVDDHAVNRSLLRDLLTPLGFMCTEADSGAAALAHLAAAAATPDLAIVDLRMEPMDGLELTRRLRADPRGRGIKVLLTSASVISFDPAEARAAGCDDFLPKPFRTFDLVAKIGALLHLTWRSAAGPAATAVVAAADAPPLPEDVRTRLREVLAQGDLEAFRAALARVRTGHPELHERWEALDRAAAGFQLSTLRALLDPP